MWGEKQVRQVRPPSQKRLCCLCGGPGPVTSVPDAKRLWQCFGCNHRFHADCTHLKHCRWLLCPCHYVDDEGPARGEQSTEKLESWWLPVTILRKEPLRCQHEVGGSGASNVACRGCTAIMTPEEAGLCGRCPGLWCARCVLFCYTCGLTFCRSHYGRHTPCCDGDSALTGLYLDDLTMLRRSRHGSGSSGASDTSAQAPQHIVDNVACTGCTALMTPQEARWCGRCPEWWCARCVLLCDACGLTFCRFHHGQHSPCGVTQMPRPPGVPSVGSALHSTGRCEPCAWFHKPQGCGHGERCYRCHLCPQGAIKARRAVKLAAVRAAKA